jgi:plastocyanin
MKHTRWLTIVGGATALLGMVVLSGPAVWAQEATPEAAEAVAEAPHPVHIHSGNCNELGEVVQPLTDLAVPQGDTVGQRRATVAATSFTVVPMTLDAILAEDHAINAHLSADEIDTYIACGEVGGVFTPDGALVIGLGETENSGYNGVAFLQPAADGVSTNVSVFLTSSGRTRDRAAEGDDAAAAEDEDAAAETLPAVEVEGTPEAVVEDEAALVSGDEVPVSLMEFAIDMPTTLPAGPVTFAVTNDGTITHSFEIENESIEEELETPLEPGQTGMLTVDLAPGTYEVYCPIGNHADNGMRTEVTVS